MILIIAIGSLIVIYFYVQNLASNFEKPIVKSITHSWGTVSYEKIIVESKVTLVNPNPLAISIGKKIGIKFTVAINDIPLIQGEKTRGELKEGEFTINFITEFDLTKVQTWWVSHLSNEEKSQVSIEGEVFLEIGSSRIVLLHKGPVTREFETDIVSKIKLEEPKDVPENMELFRVTIKSISSSWGEVNYEHTNINSIVTIYNPNNFPIPVPQFSYIIKLNDVIVGEGSRLSVAILSRKADTLLTVTTTIDNGKLDDWIVSHINNGESSNLWIEIKPEIKAPEILGGKTYSFNLLSKTISKAIITDLLNQGLMNLAPALDISLESPANNAAVSSSPVTLRVSVTSDGTPIEGADVKFYVLGTEIGSDTTNSYGIASINHALTQSTLQYTWYMTAKKEGYDSVTSSTSSFTYNPETENQNIQVIISPKPAHVNEEVVIKTVDSKLNPIDGVIIVYIKSINAIISENIITNGKYIGETNSNGELRYTFTNPEFYVIGAGKLGCYPAIGHLTVKPKPSDFNLSTNLTEITIPKGNSGIVTITIKSLNGFNDQVTLTCPSPLTGVDISLNPKTVTPPANGSAISTLTISVKEHVVVSNRILIVTGTSGIIPEDICTILLHIEEKPALTTTLLTPLDNIITSSGEVELNAEVRSGLFPVSGAAVKFYVDGEYVGQSLSGTLGLASYIYTFSEGNHLWYVTAEKEDFESSISIKRSVTYNPSESNVSLISPFNNTEITFSPVSLEVQVRDGLSPVQGAIVTFYVNGEQVGSDSTNILGQASYSYLAPLEGIYHWYVRVEKQNYVTAISPEWSFTYELPFDFIISVSPSSRTVTKGDSTTYTVTVTLVSGTPETVWLTVTGLPSAIKSFSVKSDMPTFNSILTIDTTIATSKTTHTLTISAVNLNESIVQITTVKITVI